MHASNEPSLRCPGPGAGGAATVRIALAVAALALAAPASAQLAPPPPRPAAGKALEPRTLSAPATMKAEAGKMKQFALGAGERMSWGLVIGQPGTIDVTVRATGAPIVVTLTRPNGTKVENTGSGEVRLQVQVTPQDNGSGQVWLLGVRAAGAAPGAAPQVSEQPLRREVPIVAQGTVAVSHPPGDAARAQAEVQQRAQRMTQAAGVQLSAVVERETQAAKAQADAALAARQRAVLEQLRATLASGQPLQKASGTSTRAAPIAAAAPGGTGPTLLQGRALPPAAGPSAGGVAPVGSQGAPATAAIAATITSLSASRGVPGDPVLIHGSGFGSQAGTVRIAIAPGQALAAPVVVWSDNAILAKVPDASGIPAPYRGQLSVERAGSAAASTAFEFVPATETRVLAPQLEQSSIGGPGALDGNVCHPWCRAGVDLGNLLFGHKGEDVFFRSATLKNGWRVAQVGLGHLNGSSFAIGIRTDNSADANMLETRVGTNSPYLRVGWWHDAFSSVAYWPRIVIEGPKGVPHF